MMKREAFTIVFETYQQASFWFREACKEWSSEVLWSDRQLLMIELADSTYYFVSETGFRLQAHLRRSIVYEPEAIYIILDDPERKRLETYDDKEET